MSNSVFGLEGKVAIVSGAGQGVGRSCALLFAKVGAKVAVVDMDGDLAKKVAEEVKATGGQALPITADLREPAQVTAMVAAADKGLGRVDVMVNNVGGTGGRVGKLVHDLDLETWDYVMGRNLRTNFLCSQACVKLWLERKVKGAIVNVSSLSGVRASVRNGAYGAAKAGVIHMTQTMAIELAPHGIRVNCVAPASINTPNAMRSQDPARVAAVGKAIPLGGLCQPEDVAGMVVALSSDLARFVTGQTLNCDGGLSCTTMRPPLA